MALACKEAQECRRVCAMKYAVLVMLCLLGGAIFANAYMNGSAPPARSHVDDGRGFQSISRRVAETPLFSFLPGWFFNKAAISISRERNADVLKNVLEVFDPSLRPFLTSVPIILDASANTAKAYPSKGYIGVSPDWDNTVLDSKYNAAYERRGAGPGDAVFSHRFKTDLLIHEYLHIIQARLGIDSRSCYNPSHYTQLITHEPPSRT